MTFHPSSYDSPYVDPHAYGKLQFLSRLKPQGKLLEKIRGFKPQGKLLEKLKKLKPSGKLLKKLKNRPKRERLKWWRSLSPEQQGVMMQGGITLASLGISRLAKKKGGGRRAAYDPAMDMPLTTSSAPPAMPMWGWGLIAVGVLGITVLMVRQPKGKK